MNDDIRNPGNGDWKRYGLERICPTPRRRAMTSGTGSPTPTAAVRARNYISLTETYRHAFREAGFSDFRWVDVSLQPSERGNPFWDDFLSRSPIVGFAATR